MRKPAIVVVEAHSAMGLLLDELLTGEGYQVHLWPDATGAFEFIRQKHPDLVILDLWIERRSDDLADLDQLCRDHATSDIPVIAFADDAHAFPTLRVLPVACRCQVLAKPFYIEDLIAKVRLVVAPSRATWGGAKENMGVHREAAVIGD